MRLSPQQTSKSAAHTHARPNSRTPIYAVKIGISAITSELSLTSALLGDNFTAHCGNAVACLSARLSDSSLSVQQFSARLPGVCLAILAFAYVFDIANQAFSVEEDSLNKPHRPIPSGIMSMEGGYTRWLLSWILFPILLHLTVGFQATTFLVLWEVWVLLFYVWPKFNNWAARNLFTAVGAVLQLSLLEALLTDLNLPSMEESSLRWLLFSWLVTTIHVQEFHDMDGDRKAGRQTLPLVLDQRGQFWLRGATATLIACTAISNGLRVDYATVSLEPALLLLGLCHLLSMLTVAVRLVKLPFKEADKVTYKYYYTLATYTMLHFHVCAARRLWAIE
ncbi:hypothetical protein BO82DRAFT_375096 [Aspergillus uvarum CBS 121591]|uniref:UbiA prenyltransferase n=1 Tax=Aspergillus uvarum CBS 121591 TaxID=1448315 RepID=A0A319CZU9_9EURO|nr:hypothetical protein BO82DRAFT_375096 [Aspergillus uvarum CBS 121591]PYH81198.1 hypothetical protein BO82DRAFT_375096 [Aspergillus uvarum CBS 121591]